MVETNKQGTYYYTSSTIHVLIVCLYYLEGYTKPVDKKSHHQQQTEEKSLQQAAYVWGFEELSVCLCKWTYHLDRAGAGFLARASGCCVQCDLVCLSAEVGDEVD
jgi:hypothetical protein